MKSTMKSRAAAVVAGLAMLAVVAVPSVAAQSVGQSVSIDNFAFTPGETTVTAGSSITWTNLQNVRHTATSDGGLFDSGIMTANQSFAFTFANAGDFAYHCDIHPDMVGVIHVVAAPSAVVEAPASGIEEPAPAAVEEQVPAEVEAPQVEEPAAASAPVSVAPTPTPKPYYRY